jgi:hypothetical protein
MPAVSADEIAQRPGKRIQFAASPSPIEDLLAACRALVEIERLNFVASAVKLTFQSRGAPSESSGFRTLGTM